MDLMELSTRSSAHVAQHMELSTWSSWSSAHGAHGGQHMELMEGQAALFVQFVSQMLLSSCARTWD